MTAGVPLPAADPGACGTCRRRAADGRPLEHDGCASRARLIEPPDMPGYEELGELTAEQRAELPARFHIPVWDGDGKPNAWLCAVCWGDGWVAKWPCATALEHGGDVFTSQHLAEREQREQTAEVERQAARAAEWERAVEEEIATRDEYHDVADRLAYAIAPVEVIGEHSSDNDPWANALEEVARLRAELEQARAVRCICGHTAVEHFEGVCITEVTGCSCGDYLEPGDAAEVIDRWRRAATEARAELDARPSRAEVLREAADVITAEANERDRILGNRLETSATERAVAARLRGMADAAEAGEGRG